TLALFVPYGMSAPAGIPALAAISAIGCALWAWAISTSLRCFVIPSIVRSAFRRLNHHPRDLNSPSKAMKMPSTREGICHISCCLISTRDLFVHVELATELWVHEVLNRKHLVQSFFVHEALIQDQLAYTAAGFEGLLGDEVTIVVADKWVEVGNNTDGIDHVVATHISISSNTNDALLAQGIHGVAHHTNRLEQSLADDWFHDVELQLACFSRHGYGLVIAEDLETHLVDNLRDNWVDLTWHDRRTSLAWWKVDLTQSSAWTRSQKTQVVADLGQLHGGALDRRVQQHVGATVGGSFDQIACSLDFQISNFAQRSNNLVAVTGRGVNTGTDSGCAEVNLEQHALRPALPVGCVQLPVIQLHASCALHARAGCGPSSSCLGTHLPWLLMKPAEHRYAQATC